MSSNSPKIKLGVLNMTICFDKLKSRDSSSNKKSHLSSKTQQIPTFIPRYSSHRHKATLSIDNKMNPFQQYVNNKN